MRPWTVALAQRGYDPRYVPLPRGPAERAVPVFAALFDAAPAAVFGGQSFGGRVASLVAAERPCRGLILLCYPLHPPGRPQLAAPRTAHWPRIASPVLLLSGESDPFARISLLREAVRHLARGTLITYPRLGHRLDRVREDAIGHMADWLASLTPG